ncbi:hypothetical protein FisN_12Lh129 [Fistulifera solaris]|uniref:Uncharacterized protein n=1 Tax=Fistulifera solaris TaxID=1519565 RepID=A0A1Z5JMD1_FISSO|nr:hypothetical protein FisN_12Lh129 [Fistulifera solaris]|eukprot:GAX15167.1 hypothetical protein FisN_12Lh129 [Fistulifera solaris]
MAKFLLHCLLVSYCSGLQLPLPRKADSFPSAVASPSPMEPPVSRRAMFQSAGIASAALFGIASQSNALDMDAFMNAEIESSTKNCNPKTDPKCIPKLTPDEALCKYGQSGNARAEACKRVRAAGGDVPKPGSQGKSLGGAYAM